VVCSDCRTDLLIEKLRQELRDRPCAVYGRAETRSTASASPAYPRRLAATRSAAAALSVFEAIEDAEQKTRTGSVARA